MTIAMLDTLPELKYASLGGLMGQGYAERLTTIEGTLCRGVIIFDENEDIKRLQKKREGGKVVFEGVVYHNERTTIESMHVQVVYVSDEAHQEPGATFIWRSSGT